MTGALSRAQAAQFFTVACGQKMFRPEITPACYAIAACVMRRLENNFVYA